MKGDAGGALPRAKRYFQDEDEIFHVDNKTVSVAHDLSGGCSK